MAPLVHPGGTPEPPGEDLLGKPPVPPRKAFGLWLSEYGYETWQDVDHVTDGLRGGTYPHFPDPRARLAGCRAQHIGFALIEVSYVNTSRGTGSPSCRSTGTACSGCRSSRAGAAIPVMHLDDGTLDCLGHRADGEGDEIVVEVGAADGTVHGLDDVRPLRIELVSPFAVSGRERHPGARVPVHDRRTPRRDVTCPLVCDHADMT